MWCYMWLSLRMNTRNLGFRPEAFTKGWLRLIVSLVLIHMRKDNADKAVISKLLCGSRHFFGGTEDRVDLSFATSWLRPHLWKQEADCSVPEVASLWSENAEVTPDKRYPWPCEPCRTSRQHINTSSGANESSSSLGTYDQSAGWSFSPRDAGCSQWGVEKLLWLCTWQWLPHKRRLTTCLSSGPDGLYLELSGHWGIHCPLAWLLSMKSPHHRTGGIRKRVGGCLFTWHPQRVANQDVICD